MTNLEIKISTSNLEEIKELAFKINAKYITTLYQKDTYFLVGKKRLKLREEQEKAYLVFYIRSDNGDSKFSKYHIINAPEQIKKSVKKILSLILGIKTTVNKKRELLIYKNTRIHLDTVESLGTYVELETVFNNHQEKDNLITEHNFVINSLNLNTMQKVPISYSDLIINKFIDKYFKILDLPKINI